MNLPIIPFSVHDLFDSVRQAGGVPLPGRVPAKPPRWYGGGHLSPLIVLDSKYRVMVRTGFIRKPTQNHCHVPERLF